MTPPKPSIVRGPSREDAARLSVLAASWTLLFLLVDPRGQFPLNDDFQYAECARGLLSGSGLRLPQWALSSTVSHAALGAAMTAPWGATNQALRLWMIVLGGLGAAGVYALARRWRASPDAALLAALTLALSPLWAAMSASFHIDVTASVFILAALGAFLRGREKDSAVWLAVSSLLIAASGLARQTGFLCAAGGAAALARERRLTPRTAAALLLPAGVLAAGFWAWTRFVNGPTWALESGAYTPKLVPSYWLRLDVWGTVFSRASKAAQTGALCLAPLALPRARDALRRRPGRGEAAVLVLIAGAALIGWFFTGGFPLIENTLSRSGLGAVVLAGAESKPGGWWSSPALWNAAAVIALLSSMTLARAAAEEGAGERGGELRAAALFVGAPFAAMLLMPALYDRYLLTLLPAAAAAFAAGRRESGGRLLPAFAAAALLGVWTAAGLDDYFAWNRARWDAGMAAVGRGLAPESVEDGFDWDGEFSLTKNMQVLLAKKTPRQIGVWDWRGLNRVVAETTFAGRPDSPGWILIGRFPYRTPLSRGGGEVRLYAAPSFAKSAIVRRALAPRKS